VSGPNFILLDTRLPEVGGLIAAMVQARDAVGRRSWSPQEPTTEDWWADVLADPRSRRPTTRFRDLADRRPFYRLSDEARATILVACTSASGVAYFGATN